MIDLCQWRARIGSWNCCQWSQSRDCTTSNNYCKGTSGTGRGTATTTQLKTPRLILSIFCLVILLFISGDVELNPGPTLTDKPTREELIDLLSSSKFTAGNWEQFVCCLPNMTQEVITDIKQKEKGKEKEEEATSQYRYMSAVAQYCIDNNPDMTWRRIMITLIDAKELVLLRQFLAALECSCSIAKDTSANVGKTVKKVMRNHFPQLKKVTKSWLQTFADKMYSGELINQDVHDSATFEKIEGEFSAILSLHQQEKKLKDVCQTFLFCLSSEGGPAKLEAIELAKELEREVLKKHNLTWTFTDKGQDMELNPEIEFSSESIIAIKLKELSKKFLSLSINIKKYYNDCGQYKVIDVANWMVEYVDDNNEIKFTHLATIDEIFEAARPHYNFLNCVLFVELAEDFPLNEDLKSKLKQYLQELDGFEQSTELQNMKTAISRATEPKVELTCKIVITVTGAFKNRTKKHLNRLLEHLFGKDSRKFSLISIQQGSLSLLFLVPTSLSQRLISKAESKLPYMHYLGIFKLIINGQTILGRVEYAKFSFEESLQTAIANLYTTRDVEFQRMALLLIEFDINVKHKSQIGLTALMNASEIGHYQLVESLLKKDPGINIQDNDGYTALMIASDKGHHQVVELLLSKDPDINIQNNDGWTALMRACRKGHQNVVKLLLSKNPDIGIRDRVHGLSALMIASAFGLQVVELILNRSKQSDINICDNKGMNALMMACRQGHHQVVRLILSRNPDINLRNNDGWTALMLASHSGYYQVVEVLLSKDPNINIRSLDGMTALVLASDNGHYPVIELLLQKNPDIDIQSDHGDTALMRASYKGHHRVIELLVGKDLNVNIQNINGETALILACSKGHYQVVKFLLSKNPDISIMENGGGTALMIACSKGHRQVVELLLESNPDINIQDNFGITVLMLACCLGDQEIVKLILNKHPNINIRTKDGWTALISACCYEHPQVVELLLSKNPDINIKSKDGWTALMHACQQGNHKIVELLLKKDPVIDIQNNYGVTALMLACDNGHHQVVELLLSEDLDLNIRDDDGWTAFMHACRRGYHQVVKILLNKNRFASINVQNKYGFGALNSVLFYSKFLVEFFAKENDAWITTLNLSLVNRLKTLELLLDCHPNHIHTIDDEKLHSLAVAAMANNLEAVEILVKKCVISPQNIISAFSMACYEGHSSMMILLSKKLTTLSNDERKLLVAAAEGDIGTLVSMLFEVGMSPDTPLVGGITPLMIAASCGHIDIVDTLIQAGADVVKTNDEGYTTLDVARHIKVYDRKSIVTLLANIPVNRPDPVVEKQARLPVISSMFDRAELMNSFHEMAYHYRATYSVPNTLVPFNNVLIPVQC